MQPHLSSSSLISTLLPELCFGGCAWFTELLAFSLALIERKKERKKKGGLALTGVYTEGKKNLSSPKYPELVLIHGLYGHILSSGQPKLHACQQCNWKNCATWHLTGTLSDMQVIILMIVLTYNPRHLWGFCYMYSNASAFLLPKPLLTRAYASVANLHSEISCAVYSSAYAFNNWKASTISSAEWHFAAHLSILRTMPA